MATKQKVKHELSRLERYLLDKLSISRFDKLRAWIQKHVQRYDKYLFTRKLFEKRTKLVELSESGLKEFKDAILKTQEEFLIREQGMQDIGSPRNPSKVDTMLIANYAVDEMFILNGVVGLQPMQAPVGLAFQMHFKKEETPVAVADVNLEKIGVDRLTNPETFTKLTLQISSQAVEAYSRKCKAKYSMEAMADLQGAYPMDMATELAKAMGYEIATEYVDETLGDLIRLGELPLRMPDGSEMATVTSVLAPKSVKRKSKKEIASADFPPPNAYRNLALAVARASNEIALKTRRSAANFLVCSPIVLSMIQADPSSKFVADASGKFKGPTSLMFAGELEGRFKVYTSLHPEITKGKILVGYKGNTNQVDAGYILCPYLPVVPAGLVMDYGSFLPMAQFYSRYGKLVHTDPEALERMSISNTSLSQNYYRTIDVSQFIKDVLGLTE